MLTLRSPDPTAKPLHPAQLLRRGLRHADDGGGPAHAEEIGAQPALAPYTSRLYYEPASESEADLRAYIRRQTFTLYHPVGTCRMGSDADAVLDTELRVRGVEGLRVVDASVMPSVAAATPTPRRSRSPSARPI